MNDEKDPLQKVYMTDARSKTLGGFVVALDIFAKYLKNDSFCFGAEHDVFHIYVDNDVVSDEDALLLSSLGWHKSGETDNWAYFT